MYMALAVVGFIALITFLTWLGRKDNMIDDGEDW